MVAILAEAALRSFMLGSVVWLGLKLLRVRNPHVHMTSWGLVLAASLAMPLLMQWTEVTITVPSALPAAVQESLSAEASLADTLRIPLSSETVVRGTSGTTSHHTFDWWTAAAAIYATITG